MANNIQNLKPRTTLSKEEAKEMGRKGGIASGIARRERKTMREMLIQCLEMTNSEGQTYQELATIGLLKGAMKGDSRNFKVIMEALGEIEDANRSKQENEMSKLDMLLDEIKKEAQDGETIK